MTERKNGVTTGRKSGDIYCVKCRRKTANKNLSVKRAKMVDYIKLVLVEFAVNVSLCL